MRKQRWPEVSQVLTAVKTLTLLSPLGETVGLLTWSSAGKQKIPDICKDVLPSS